MKRLQILLCAILALVLSGCSLSALDVQREVAHDVAVAFNDASPVVFAFYQQGGDALVEKWEDYAKANPSEPADSIREKALQELEQYERDWALFWDAHERMVIAHSAWVDALELGDEAHVLEMSYAFVRSYCSAVKMAPSNLPPAALKLEGIVCHR